MTILNNKAIKIRNLVIINVKAIYWTLVCFEFLVEGYKYKPISIIYDLHSLNNLERGFYNVYFLNEETEAPRH